MAKTTYSYAINGEEIGGYGPTNRKQDALAGIGEMLMDDILTSYGDMRAGDVITVRQISPKAPAQVLRFKILELKK